MKRNEDIEEAINVWQECRQRGITESATLDDAKRFLFKGFKSEKERAHERYKNRDDK